MRAGLSTIQQTLTPEAAAVLNRSIAEAARRGHGQTTPLHVAATLLAFPSGLLRQACVRSHPSTSHPLECRALELCFSVALDRLPSASNTTISSATPASVADAVAEPPISNALMAALKRAQAHQRRGCPEQQQQPLLAVKVELEQLVVSILDDPGVSRVMREASFSSPAVKATIEQSLSSSSSFSNPSTSTTTTTSPSASSSSSLGLGLGIGYRPPSRSLYINPRLQQHHQQSRVGSAADNSIAGDPQRKEDVKKVIDILTRTKKRNPVLVGDSEPEAVTREVLRSIQACDAPRICRTYRVISMEEGLASTDRTQIPTKIRELGDVIDTQLNSAAGDGGGGVILDLGDLKWLVESPSSGGLGGSAESVPVSQQQIISEMGRAVVAEMGRLLARFSSGGGGGSSRVWLVGTAACATYLRCQVYHPTMENDWDLHAFPIAPRSPLPGLFPRLGGNGILSSSVESLSPSKGFPAMGATTIPPSRPAESTSPTQRSTLCPLCMENYKRELAKLEAKEFEKSSSDSRPEPRQALPQWLRMAPPSSATPTTNQAQGEEQELKWTQSPEELLKRWRETCARLHPDLHSAAINAGRPRAPFFSMPCSYNPRPLPHQPLRPKLTLSQSITPLKSSNLQGTVLNSLEHPASPPGSPVKTDLELGRPKISVTHQERVKDFTTGFTLVQKKDKIAGISDVGSFKRLFTGLNERVSWQPEVASAVATVVMQCKSGNEKRRNSTPKSDTWLLFIGFDRVGKKKMAAALSELVYSTGPITINLGRPRSDADDGESDFSLRGKTAVDKVAEAVRQNPFSVVVLEDFDRADLLVVGTIKRAMDRGRLQDSCGRDVSLGSIIFVLTTDCLPDDLKCSQESLQLEEKILEAANSGWQLELSTGKKSSKRRAEWQCKDERPAKPRKESCAAGLSLDLNLEAGLEDDAGEGSRNSSDLTVEHEHEHGQLMVGRPTSSLDSELIDLVDDTILFKPVDFGPLRQRVSETISLKFAAIMGNARPLQVDGDALDRMVGGLWLSGAAAKLDEWAERVFVPSIYQLKSNLNAQDGTVVRLCLAKGGERGVAGDWLPRAVSIAVDVLEA